MSEKRQIMSDILELENLISFAKGEYGNSPQKIELRSEVANKRLVEVLENLQNELSNYNLQNK